MTKKNVHQHPELTAEVARELLYYFPETGELRWKRRSEQYFPEGKHTAATCAKRGNTKFAGKLAFITIKPLGYRYGSIFGRKYYAHRLVWLLHYGHWPQFHVDHINGIRTDNRIENLRDVSRSENRMLSTA